MVHNSLSLIVCNIPKQTEEETKHKRYSFYFEYVLMDFIKKMMPRISCHYNIIVKSNSMDNRLMMILQSLFATIISLTSHKLWLTLILRYTQEEEKGRRSQQKRKFLFVLKYLSKNFLKTTSWTLYRDIMSNNCMNNRHIVDEQLYVHCSYSYCSGYYGTRSKFWLLLYNQIYKDRLHEQH